MSDANILFFIGMTYIFVLFILLIRRVRKP